MTTSLSVPRLADGFSAIGRALTGRVAAVALAGVLRRHDLLHVAGDIDRAIAAVRGQRTGHFHHVRHVVRSGLAEVAHRLAVAARIVFFFHQHVERAVGRQQADGLPRSRALLSAEIGRASCRERV